MFIAGGLRGRRRRHACTEETTGLHGGNDRFARRKRQVCTEETTGLHGGNYRFTGRKLMQSARSIYAERPPHNCRVGVQYMRSEGSACIFDGSINMKAKTRT